MTVAYRLQQVQCLLINATLFEIRLRSIAHLIDDLVIDLTLHRSLHQPKNSWRWVSWKDTSCGLTYRVTKATRSLTTCWFVILTREVVDDRGRRIQ